MTTPYIRIVKKEDISRVWYEVAPILKKAIRYSNGETTVDDVFNLIQKGQQLLWIGFKDNKLFCAGTTEFIHYPRKKALRIILFATVSGYDFEVWNKFADLLELFGSDTDCSILEAWTRKGLAKKLNWDNHFCVITKQIKHQSKEAKCHQEEAAQKK